VAAEPGSAARLLPYAAKLDPVLREALAECLWSAAKYCRKVLETAGADYVPAGAAKVLEKVLTVLLLAK